ncbi:MAG: putative manganese-dependent inorganic diphosphatase [Eubacteriales bacterium]|nr:putative manganese-dependent inorganic diphosphatase [Eubacteriales bacterium]
MSEKNKQITVIGHKNPDTDSICSAIAYASLKSALDPETDYRAGRSGQINGETQYVLDYFGVKSPEYVSDVKTRISDIEIRKAPGIGRNTSLKKAWEQMKGSSAVTLPVTDDGKLEGIITIKDIVNAYMEIYDQGILAQAQTPYSNLIETLDGELIIGDPEDTIASGRILVGAGNPEIMEEYIEPDDIVIVSNRSDAQICAIEMGAKCIIVTNGTTIPKTTKALAQAKGCSIISTKHDSYSVARLINQSAPVGHFMKKDDVVTFREDTYIDDVKKVMAEKRYRDFPVLDVEGKYCGMISRRYLMDIQGRQLILVDHNEKTQAVDGIDEASILEIIDHHRLASIETMSPIFFRNQPVGCTATIIEQMYREAGITPGKEVSGLLCAAILSDTLLFRSPTCTPADVAAGERLAAIAGIDMEKFASDMFHAGSSLTGKTAEEIFYQDYKTFSVNGIKFGVGQISSIDKTGLEDVKKLLEPYMQGFSQSHGIDMACMLLTNIIEEGSELMFEGEIAKDVLKKAFRTEVQDGETINLPGVVSRKKQFIPAIMASLQG